jgi:hypothetical protein
MKHLIALLCSLSLIGLALAGCSSTACPAGDTCDCDGEGVCTWDCAGADCEFGFDGNGTADFTCDGGGCAGDFGGNGDATMTCDGGGCTVDASGNGTVELGCSGGDCTLTCSGNGTCTLTDCEDDSCTLDCDSITATCNEE